MMNPKFIFPKIIEIDFYDGATEGFASSVKEFETCYFKMIAWDKMQDMRLFVVNLIEFSIFERFENLLNRAGKNSDSSVWLGSWQFKNEIEKQEVEKIIKICSKSLPSSNYLALGEGMNDKNISIYQICNHIRPQVSKALEKDKFDCGDLDDWLPELGEPL